MDSQLQDSIKISVIIPCFNAAHTLQQQLDALMAQTQMPWEVIVADNGSTDRSREIVQQYRDRLPQLQIIDASTRRGPSHARNCGAKAATGDYLIFCDADDVVSSDWVSALAQAFGEHDFVASRFDYTLLNDSSGNHPQQDGLQNFRIPFMPFAGGCGLGIKRSLHEAVAGFDESLSHLEDVDYCLRVQLQGAPLVFVPDALIHIRYSASQETSFLASRKGSFRHGYHWGMGQANLYKRYKTKGMHLHGMLPRLVVGTGWALRCFLSGFSCSSVWRMGWHTGVLSGLIQNGIVQL
ncbi:MAG: glycosyltransferase family A protein [Leptolyngbyaceae cyanobacterium bins.349]|nr:glycosyltransferase family A protein [Leptolyngbyaceae cyanobacterium bins.349]